MARDTLALIRRFEPGDQAAARQLILAGLGEHFGSIDETRNPDLDDITGHYSACRACFLVALVNGRLVGTAALIAEGESQGRIVRVSVAPLHRRQGIGRALVQRLLDAARARHFTRVRVATDIGWDDALGLYVRCGFHEYARDAVEIHLQVDLTDR